MPEINLPSNLNIALPDPLAEQQAEQEALPQGPVRMVDPQGKVYEVPATSYKVAIQNGWAVQTDQDREHRALVKAEADKSGTLEVFAKNLINEGLFGVPDMVEDADATPDRARFNQEVRERELKNHPIAGYAGKGIGFAAPLLIPGVGEVGEGARLAVEGGAKLAERAAIETAATKLGQKAAANAADIALSKKVAGSVAKYAAEGAIYSTPQAAVQATYGDPEQAAETMLWGVGLSGLLGGAGRLIGEGAGAASRAAGRALTETQSNGVTYLDDIARNVLGISDKQANKLGPQRLTKIVERADQEGILTTAPGKREAAIKRMVDDSGKKIGEHYEQLEELLSKPGIKELGPVPTSTAEKFQAEITEKMPEVFSETHTAQSGLVSKIVKDIESGGIEPSFTILQQIRKTISKAKGDFLADSASAKIIRLADSVIQRDLETAAEQVFHAGELPKAFGDYLLQKERYSTGLALAENINPFKGTGKLPFDLHGMGFHGGLAALGAGVGGAHGGAEGAAEGALIGMGGRFVLKSLVSNKGGLLGKGVSYLRGVADSEVLGGLMAKEGTNAFQAHLDKIPAILSKDTLVSHSVAAANPVQHLIGDTTGLSHQTQYNKLVQAIQQAAVDQNLTSQLVGAHADPFTSHNLQLGSLVAQKQFAALNYLVSSIPQAPPPKPFQKNDWKPTLQQQQEFLRKVQVVNDPMSVWKAYQEGNLSKVDRDCLKTVYPKIYQAMVNKITETAFDPRAKPLSHDQRMSISMFTGVPLDNSLKNVAHIQQTLAIPGEQMGQPQPNKPRGGPRGTPAEPRPSSRPHFDRMPTLQTDSQRRTYR